MLKTMLGGIAVGIANIIPGVSGGTMMVMLGIFHKVTDSISSIFTPSSKDKKQSLIFLCEVGIGAVIGLVGFAKILTYLFQHYETQTMFWFIGMVAFSVPIFLKSEMKGNKINWIAATAGAAVIFIITLLNPGEQAELNPIFPEINMIHCIKMVIIGMIGGFTMLLPGVSGSMVLLIIGQYHLFKSYLANATSMQIDVILPLGCMGIGIALGIVLASMLTKWAMAKNAAATASFLLGLIIASSIVLIPLHADYNLITVSACLFTFFLGGGMVFSIDHYS